MPKQKIGKDVIGKKSAGIVQTVKEREEFEDWKRKRAEDAAKKEKNEKKEQELHRKKINSRMPENREPLIKGLTPEDFAKMKALSKLKKKAQTQ